MEYAALALCNDGRQVPLLPVTVTACRTLTDVVQCSDVECPQLPVPLPAWLLELVQRHSQDPPPPLPSNVGELCQLTEAANYLGQESLFQRCVQEHTDIIKLHGVEQLRQLYQCPDDLPLEEKREMWHKHLPYLYLSNTHGMQVSPHV